MKRCNRCGAIRSLSEFHRNHRMPDGRFNQCRECRRIANRAWRHANPEQVKATRERWLQDNRKKNVEYQDAWRRRNMNKARAHRAVYRALRDGRLVRPMSCERCGHDGRLNAHHEDYSQQLVVVWLCIACHNEEHSGAKAAA